MSRNIKTLLNKLKNNVENHCFRGEFLLSTARPAYYWISLESLKPDEKSLYIKPISKYVLPWLSNQGINLVIVPNVKFFSMGIIRNLLHSNIYNIIHPEISPKEGVKFNSEDKITLKNKRQGVLVEPLSLHIDLIIEIMKQTKREGCDILYVIAIIGRDMVYVKEQIEAIGKELGIKHPSGGTTKILPLILFEEDFEIDELLYEQKKPRISTVFDKEDLVTGDRYLQQFHSILESS